MGVGYATHPTWLFYTLKIEAIISPQKIAITHRLHGVIKLKCHEILKVTSYLRPQ
jgi:hypothetical protein